MRAATCGVLSVRHSTQPVGAGPLWSRRSRSLPCRAFLPV